MALNPASTDRVVCQCLCVRESEIRHAVNSGRALHLFDVMDQTKAGSGCNGCQRAVRKIVSEIQPATTPHGSLARSGARWLLVGREDGRSPGDGFEDLDVLQRSDRDLARVLVEDDEVGLLAERDRAFAVLFEVLVGGA